MVTGRILCDLFITNGREQVQIKVAVHGLKLESRNSGEMKRVYELDVYKIERIHQQYKNMKAKFPISIF